MLTALIILSLVNTALIIWILYRQSESHSIIKSGIEFLINK